MLVMLVSVTTGRREFLVGSAGMLMGGVVSATPEEAQKMYGLIGSMTAVAGRRSDLIALLTEAVSEMPGCLSYVVAEDSKDENTIWITEVWDKKESHDLSLSLPAVKKAISAGRPLMAGFGSQVITTPVGGYGLAAAPRR